MDFQLLDWTRKEKRECVVVGCRKAPDSGRSFCRRCRDRRHESANPALYAFGNLKKSAKRRGHSFTLTLDEFIDFCNETGYLILRGKQKDLYTIDRIRSNEGYCKGNIRILSNSENAAKGNRDIEKDDGDDPF